MMSRMIRGLAVLGLAGAFLLCSCSTNLGPETLPSTTPATEPAETTITEETEVPEETVIPEETEPSSVAVVTESIVDNTGRLKVDGSKITDSEGETVVLKGMSSFAVAECGDFFTPETIKTLAEDWGCDVLRIKVTGDEDSGGYLKDPDRYFDMVCKICNMCIDQGIYVIVDWDVLYADDYDDNSEYALDFFSRLSTIYSDSENIIYEVNNYALSAESEDEDDDEDEDTDEWEDLIKPFASEIIETVRENNPDCIFIVGAPENGLGVDTASDSMFDYDNICYGCRIFSGTHKQDYRDRISEALDNGACVFITEWSYCTDACKGGIFSSESDKWAAFMEENDISWCNYAIGSDIDNDTNAILMHSDNYTFEQKYSGHWPDGLISKSGLYARELLLKDTLVTEETEETEESPEDE